MTALAVEALFASTLLMVLVLAARMPVRRAFGPRVAYALWLLPVLRLALPPLPDGWRGEALPVLPVAEPMTISLGEPLVTLPADGSAGTVGWIAMMLGVWLAGAAAFLVWQAARYLRFRHRVLRNGIAVDRAGSVTIVESVAATGPLAFGVFDRVVAFPRDFAARFDAAERELALAHELGHHARGDLVANWVGLGVLALHWFNPVAWMAYRAFRADQEMANDAGVMERCGTAARHAYGCAIVKAAHGQALSAACHLHNVKDLKGRLRMLARGRLSRRRVVAGAGLSAGLAVLALGATASGTRAAERVRGGVEEAAGIELTAVDNAIAEATPALSAVPREPEAARAHRIVVNKDGLRTIYEGAAADAYAAFDPAVPAPPPVPPAAPLPPVVPLLPTVIGNVRVTAPAPPVAPDAPPAIRDVRVVDMNGTSSVIRDCAANEGSPSAGVIHVQDGGMAVRIVCRNRIEQWRREAVSRALTAQRSAVEAQRRAEREAARAEVASERAAAHSEALAERAAARAEMTAERQAADARKMALRDALARIESARATFVRQRGLTSEQRTQALAGMDRALNELRANIARRD